MIENQNISQNNFCLILNKNNYEYRNSSWCLLQWQLKTHQFFLFIYFFILIDEIVIKYESNFLIHWTCIDYAR